MNTIRICVDCKAHRAIEDGSRCHDCLNAFLRQTRPLRLVTSPWVRKALDGTLPPKVAA